MQTSLKKNEQNIRNYLSKSKVMIKEKGWAHISYCIKKDGPESYRPVCLALLLNK